MKMFLLRSIVHCQQCRMSIIVVIRAESELAARQIASTSNAHGVFVTGIDWLRQEEAACYEYPLLDGPQGIVVGSGLDQYQPG